MKYFILLLLATVLYGKESCYTVQLLSQTSSDKNRNLLLQNNYDSSCKVMEIGKNLTVRCGCFMSMEDVEKTLPAFKKEYKNAYITSTYKSRFKEKKQVIKEEKPILKKEIPVSIDIGIKNTKKQTNSKKQDTFNINTPVRDVNMCVKNVNTLLNETYKNYPSIKASRQMILSKQAKVESAKWNYFPTPSIDISQRADRKNMTFRLEQPLWTGGKLDAKRDIAVSEYEEAQSTLEENRYILTEEFLTILQNYIESEEQIKGFLEGRKQLVKFSEMVERRVFAGASSRTDKELLNSRIAQINSDLMIARSKYSVARSQMNLLLGHPLRCEIGFENDKTLNQTQSLDQMKEILVNTHPELKKLQSQVSIAEAEKKSVDAEIMPSVLLRAEYQDGSIYTNDQSDDSFLYLNFSYTPGAGLSAISNMESAKYAVMQTKNELKTKKLKLLNILVSYYEDYHSSIDRLESINQTIRLSNLVLKSYTRLFIAGKRQWLDLVNMSREVTQNRISMATIKAMYITASYRLALQTGNINFEGK